MLAINQKQQNNILYIALSIVAIVVLYAVFKIIIPMLKGVGDTVTGATAGFTNDKQEQEQKKKTADAVSNLATSQKVKVNGQSTTKTVAEWNMIAATIHENIRYSTSVSNDVANAVYEVCRVKNDADFKTLVSEYGQRDYDVFFGIAWSWNDKQNLVTRLKSVATAAQISAVNDNYKRKGMTTRL